MHIRKYTNHSIKRENVDTAYGAVRSLKLHLLTVINIIDML